MTDENTQEPTNESRSDEMLAYFDKCKKRSKIIRSRVALRFWKSHKTFIYATESDAFLSLDTLFS